MWWLEVNLVQLILAWITATQCHPVIPEIMKMKTTTCWRLSLKMKTTKSKAGATQLYLAPTIRMHWGVAGLHTSVHCYRLLNHGTVHCSGMVRCYRPRHCQHFILSDQFAVGRHWTGLLLLNLTSSEKWCALHYTIILTLHYTMCVRIKVLVEPPKCLSV